MRPFSTLARLARSRSGAAAIEFTFLLPLLLIFCGIVFETGRIIIYYQRMVTVVDNTARFAARFPEFDSRARSGALLYAQLAGPPSSDTRLDLTLRSAKLNEGTPQLAFPAYNIMGNAQDVAWQDTMKGSGFLTNEAAIIVSGRYRHQISFIFLFTREIDLTYVAATNPYFSRDYRYNDGVSDQDYWNAI